jgi:Ca2+-transporting ATPase
VPVSEDPPVGAADPAGRPPYAQDSADVVAGLGSDAASGLTAGEAAERLSRHGPNAIEGEKPPTVWAVAAQQLRDPMNIMLVAVTAVSFIIGEVSTGVIVALLILLNVVLGSRQELNARASIDALSYLQVPHA